MADYPALDLDFPFNSGTPAFLELLHARLDDFDPIAIEDTDTGWRVFFRAASHRDCARAALLRSFDDRLSDVRCLDVPDEGWAERIQARLTPVRVAKVVVAPPWAKSEEPGAHVIIIQPSMGFGTGHHATTRLCLRLLQQVPLAGTTVIDVGTGSGVLAIAAWMLGASRALAIDCDPDALNNARENIALNGATEAIDAVNADLGAYSGPPAAVVLANLTSAVLQRHARELRRAVAEPGHLIVSGFAPDELGEVERALALRCAESIVEAGWCAARFSLPPRAS